MSTIDFYKAALRRCKCGRGATYEIQATGNVKYDVCCDRCADRRVRELTKVHAPLNKSLAQDSTQ